ncbi:hypothetical protein IFVP22_C290381 [Vibrio parahaemolyticus]
MLLMRVFLSKSYPKKIFIMRKLRVSVIDQSNHFLIADLMMGLHISRLILRCSSRLWSVHIRSVIV